MKAIEEMMTPAGPDTRIGQVEIAISHLLRIGVTTSMVIILVGLTLMFVHHPNYLHAGSDLQRLTAPGAAFPHTLHDVAQGLGAYRGQAVIALGLMVLIATPILRVAASIIAFAVERDLTYVLITSAVLAILLASFLLGRME
jgi:uncharacterized membrane protein